MMDGQICASDEKSNAVPYVVFPSNMRQYGFYEQVSQNEWAYDRVIYGQLSS